MNRIVVVHFALLVALFGGWLGSALASDEWMDCGSGIRLNRLAIRSIESLFGDKVLVVFADGESTGQITVADYFQDQLIASCQDEAEEPDDYYEFSGNRSSQNFRGIDLTPGLWSFEVTPPAMLAYMDVKTDPRDCVDSYSTDMIVLDATLQVGRDCTAFINLSYTDMEMATEYTFTIQKLN